MMSDSAEKRATDLKTRPRPAVEMGHIICLYYIYIYIYVFMYRCNYLCVDIYKYTYVLICISVLHVLL